MFSFARELARFQPARAAILFALLICAAATESITLISLVPMIELFGSGETGASQISAWIGTIFAAVGWSPSLRGIILLFLLAIVARALILYAITDISARASMAWLHHLRTELFAALASARWQALTRQSRAGLCHALTNVPYQLSHGLAVVVGLFSSAGLVAVGCLLALATEPATTSIVLIAAAILAVPMLAFSRATYRLSEAEYEKASILYERIGAYLNNAKLSRFIGRTGGDPGGFNETSRQDAELLRRIERIDATASLVHQIGAVILLAVAIGAVSRFNAGDGQEGNLTSIAILAVIFARILPQAQVLFSNLRQLAEIAAPHKAYHDLLTVLRSEREETGDPCAANSGPPAIRLENVSYTHDGEIPALNSVSVAIPAGSALAVVGPSGAGKTTLADILCGLLPPSGGAIVVDGKPILEADHAAWRDRIGLVCQDEFILPGTVRDNVAPCGGVSDADIWAALERTGLADRIRRTPEQLGLAVGERGERLSRGERQRLGLARALAHKPDVLILDEATSALNPVDEAEIIRGLAEEKGRMTMVIIAHRLSTLVHTDRMITLENGCLTESGPTGQLAGRPGSFASRMQAADTRVSSTSDDGAAEPRPRLVGTG